MKPAAAPDILLEITERRRQRLGGEAALRLPGPAPRQDAEANELCAALTERRGAAVIAEVKMGSPKLGSLVGSFDPEEQARVYARNGAAALSVVVEPDFFFGSYELLERCRRASGLPAIAKDFDVTPKQLELARRAGASAVLLIAALHDADCLWGYAEAARDLGLVPLVETHSLADVAKLGDRNWELVGVNNRDLRDFSVDLQRSIDLVPRLPPTALKVAESGIRDVEDLHRLRDGGFDAFLVGETLVKARDPGLELRRLLETAAGGEA
ncbi:MAG: indole-3-glycerol-phosphate synthase [Acidobacteria bacterium]|nr:indole-3-glycerol-phosphate synthase [Acidobacteriota bacterium]